VDGLELTVGASWGTGDMVSIFESLATVDSLGGLGSQ
jgi:hypothetical protein